MSRASRAQGWLRLAARLALGGVFIYLGLAKALDPVGFLKLLRQFDVLPGPLVLNSVAAILPWCEVLCGAALVLGARVPAAALVLLVMLAGFTVVVAVRAWSIHRAGALPFCAIRFDCGCGSGDVIICPKLLQNVALMALAGFLLPTPPQASGGNR